ncbi:DUF3237 family protein [Actinotalea subterranea]|uniref:DUF3237 family protein n=1 Tax=Actinotalea subterranea TaxID=2607497 RepID=UPI0011ECB182|nr:DUF3237 family protein [Actinotalea subterranea]
MELSQRHAFTIEAVIGAPVEVGATAAGFRRVIPILGGTVSDGLSGTVLPGGADWNVVRADGSVHLWARYELRTDDGAVVSVLNEGVHDGRSPLILTRPTFEVGAGGPTWLATGFFVGVLTPPVSTDRVRIEVHLITAQG